MNAGMGTQFFVTIKCGAFGKLASVNRLTNAIQACTGGKLPLGGCFGANYVQLDYRLGETEVGTFITAIAQAPLDSELSYRVMPAQ